MSKHIPTYRETKSVVVKICLSCKYVKELPESKIDCPSCKSVGYLGFWDSPEKFQRYIQLYKPKDLKIVGDHLQFIYDEVMEDL